MSHPSAMTVVSTALLLAVFGAMAVSAMDQQVTIVLLHRRGSDCTTADSNTTTVVSTSALQREAAARWAAQSINNQTRPHLFTIGVEVMDTCGRIDTAAKRSLQIVRQSNQTALLGVIALEDRAEVLGEAARVLRRHRIPLVVATPRASEAVQLYADDSFGLEPDNVFSAAPNTATVARATAAVAKGIQSPTIRILGTAWQAIRMAERAAHQLRVRVAAAQHFRDDFDGSVAKFVDSIAAGDDRVVLLMESDELAAFMNQAVRMAAGKRITWLMGCVGGISAQLAAQWALDLSSSAFLIEPHLLELAGLADYMVASGIPHHPLDIQIPHIVQAVSSLGAAFHLQELSSCVQQPAANSTTGDEGEFSCGTPTEPSLVPAQMLNSLRQLSLPPSSRNAGARELEGTSNRFTPSGHVVAHRYLVKKLVAGSGESSPVAWYSDDQGLVLAAVMTSQSRFDFFGHTSSGPLLSPVLPFVVDERIQLVSGASETQTAASTPTDAHLPEREVAVGDEEEEDPNQLLITASPSARPLYFVQGRTWAASILAIAATELLAAVYILAVFVARCCDGTIRPAAQTMSLLILVVVMAQLGSVTCYVIPTVPVEIKTFVPAMTAVTVYALLLAKLLQYRNLASAGLGGSVPQFPLYLAVVLAASVQAALSAHLYARPHDPILVYSFLMALVGLTAAYALALKQIRRQHAEARLILVAALVSALFLAAWAVAVSLVECEFRDALTATLLCLLSATILGSVFIPRVVSLARQKRLKLTPIKPRNTYACNISMASNIASPWLDYNFTTKPAAMGKIPAPGQLCGSALMRHPVYTGHHCN